MKITVFPLLLLCALIVGAPVVRAEKADRNKPMNIEADTLRYDDARQTSVFTGKVLLTKGSIMIRGAQVEVRQDADGTQVGIVTGSTEAPAFFRQKRDGVDEYIEGEALSIEYDGKADTVKFLQKAHLRRLRGASVADEISGALITYDNLSDRFSVDGSAVSKAGSVGSSGRVKAMLSPKPESGGVQNTQTAPLPLRSSAVLEGAGK